MEWQDISTAPKDGTVFWGLWDNCGKQNRIYYVYAARASKRNPDAVVFHMAESRKYNLIAWKPFAPGDEKLNMSKYKDVILPPLPVKPI
jgi:hypothetical protein